LGNDGGAVWRHAHDRITTSEECRCILRQIIGLPFTPLDDAITRLT